MNRDASDIVRGQCERARRTADENRNDAIARDRDFSSEQRPAFHQAKSGPVMEQFRTWCMRQFEDRLVEPNSAPGQAISHLRRPFRPTTTWPRPWSIADAASSTSTAAKTGSMPGC